MAKINIKWYNQAHHTPFGCDLPFTWFGWHTASPHANALLSGTLSPNRSSLIPETVHILWSIARPLPVLPATDSSTITDDEFISLNRVVLEDTSTSPSGHHIGHYKAVLKHPRLVSLHASMMSIPFQTANRLCPHSLDASYRHYAWKGTRQCLLPLSPQCRSLWEQFQPS